MGTLLVDKMLQLKFPAEYSFRLPTGEVNGFTPYRTPRLAAIFGHEQNYGLQDSPRSGCPFVDGGVGREESTSRLNTCLERKAIEDSTDFLE